MEALRDAAADRYEQSVGSPWRPHSGSLVNHRALTAAMIDSRDFINAKRRAETEALLPAGARIAFTGGPDFNDHARIWDALDKVRAKHLDMVLLHGGTPTGAERIAACWADSRKVPQISFKPNWTRHAKAAPFKRNDQLLEALPIGVIAFPGPASTPTSATRRRGSASRFGNSIAAARKRRFHQSQRCSVRRALSARGTSRQESHCTVPDRTAIQGCAVPPILPSAGAARLGARVSFLRSTKSAPPRPAGRRLSASLTRSDPARRGTPS